MLISKVKNISLKKMAFLQLATMILLTFITQAITLTKTSIIAACFGATVQMDAFNFSNSIGTFVYSFIGTGITTVLIPAIINKKDRKSINNFITVIYGASLICVFLIFFSRRYMVSVFSSGTTEFVQIACNIMLITLVSQFFNTVLGVTNAVFQCNEKFNIPKIITLLTTILLTFLILMNIDLSIYQYSLYILITMVLNVIIQCGIVYKDGFRYTPVIDFKDEELKKMLKIFIPTMFSSGLYQVSLLTDSIISSNLGQGKISILTYSNTIMAMINMLLVGNIMTYIYPRITKNTHEDDGQKRLFDYSIFFSAIMCVIVVGFIIVGKEGITFLFERGRFDSSITNVVYICSLIYIIGLPINVIRDIVYRYFYAKGNTKTTFINSLFASVINIVISIILSYFIGLYGVVLGTVITSVYSLTTILIRFKNQYGMDFNKRYVIVENCKIILVSVIAVVIATVFKNIFNVYNNFLSILLWGSLSVILYILGLFLVKSKVYKIKL